MKSMTSIVLGSTAAIMAAVVALAAELPSMKSTSTQHAKACNVGGMAGVVIPGSDMCVKIGGYISGGVEAGNLRQQNNGPAGSLH
jgi:hypothetical protein